MNIRIEWLTDSSDCDQAGCSGGYAEGARIFDGPCSIWFELLPSAGCFGGDTWSQEEVFAEILNRLGHSVTFEYGG
jgi:hypothetical protein